MSFLTVVVLVGVAVLVVVVGVVVSRLLPALSLHLPAAPGSTASGDVQPPGQLGAAASCERVDTDGDVQRCVIPADHPLLWGGITADKSLVFTMSVTTDGQIADTIRRWRAANIALCDGRMFVGIDASDSVRYANPHTRVQLSTEPFASRSGAQAFVWRSGLVC
ncbi:hypothetical protein F3087_40380 [Nocardia colli]|uniref:Uncharacterized protein n=1 Tax=Nocardia colli TaxID=2545717 RepID=A0A5N0DW57_9NOCA|nr:hypothetical protein [Nocardia colli]KAA8880580.1 hypothetical protein F3087_40380 [Nocardia colli]